MARPIDKPRPSHSYRSLQADLTALAPAVLNLLITGGSLKDCQGVSQLTGQYLAERGWAVDSRSSGRYSCHFAVKVRTSDRGWLHVDGAHAQFHVPYDYDVAEAIATRRVGRDAWSRMSSAEQESAAMDAFQPTRKLLAHACAHPAALYEVTSAASGAANVEATSPPPLERAETWSEVVTRGASRFWAIAGGDRRGYGLYRDPELRAMLRKCAEDRRA